MAATDVLDVVTPRDYCARGGGIIDERFAFVAAQSASASVYVPPGDYRIASDLTISAGVEFAPGARLVVPTGATVAIAGSFSADIAQVFVCTGTGKVVFTKLWLGYPEWWGAQIENADLDCSVAINACIVACSVTQLSAGRYYTTGTINMTTNLRTLQGVHVYPYNTLVGGAVTQIVINSPTVRGMLVGSDTIGGGGSTAKLGITVRDLSVMRGVAPTASAGLGAVGIAVKYCLFPSIEYVVAWDHNTDFYISGNIQARLYRTYAARALAATNPGSDFWTGYYLDGTSGIAAAGGNASSYLDECQGGAASRRWLRQGRSESISQRLERIATLPDAR